MKKLFIYAAFTAALIFTNVLQAQFGGPNAGASAPTLKSGEWKKLLGNIDAFSAKCDVQLTDKSEKENTSMALTMSYLDGKMRTDMDMSKMKGAQMPPEAVAQMKQMGMDKMTAIIRPDTKKMLLIYPGLQGYVENALPKEEEASLEKEPKIEKSVVGKETVEGHPTVKNKITLTDDNGNKTEYLVWTATDLKDFPIRLKTDQEGQTITMTYQDVKLAKPDAKQFEVPSGYTRYETLQQMMMQKMLGK